MHYSCREPYSEIALPHVCPECNGNGHIVTAYAEHNECCHGGTPNYGGFGAFAGCEYCPNIRTIKTPTSHKKCDLCDGKGRLKNKPLPVMSQTGWKRA